MNALVTKESLQQLLDRNDPNFVMHVIGRALVALYNNQTNIEQSNNRTTINNNIGFNGTDARSGSITAKYYLKNKRLEDWMVEKWIKRGKNNYGRLVKYHKQLNEIAVKKRLLAK